MKRFAVLLLAFSLGMVAAAQQSASPKIEAPARTPAPAQVPSPSNPEFLKAADEVLAQMSQILALPIKEPLKKSLRSKQEIREYLVVEEKEDRTDAQRHADNKTLEAFGLIPKDFPLDSFMLDVLTDQVADQFEALVFLLARTTDEGVVPVRAKDHGLDARLPDPQGRTLRGWQAKRFT